jgi:hypothetical protein
MPVFTKKRSATLSAEQPATPSHPPDTWLDEEISSLVEAVDAHALPASDGVEGAPVPGPRRRPRRRRRRNGSGPRVRAVGLPFDIRGVDLVFVALGVVLALLVVWGVSR